eukprot:CAMPEP_0194432704 /NCGR_PEP_ID=MMETSP0176-20130528/72193_1 /TAXON_ID=216777 /ORGANISM="Proboscia alata, Strain PI-D3" /LENGTH=389 /DNA_ID=CAMNT_0039249229 /DNA_START=208 /DNA_END=1373 /DNA_ORIENTATION=-
MKEAEAALTNFSHRFATHIDGYDRNRVHFELFDFSVPKASMSSLSPSATCQVSGSHDLVLHGIKVNYNRQEDQEHPSSKVTASTAPPLVLLHGYANGALYYYRNIIGLSHYFPSVYSLDLMGWGLSSRPNFDLVDTSVEAAERFFIDSLEEWRKANNIDKMVLGGHSMGGYLSVAYCEKYPQHVDHLILLSPVGVSHKEVEEEDRIKRGVGPAPNVPFVWWAARTALLELWEWDFTPSLVLRILPEENGRDLISNYIQRRLEAIACPEEQAALTEYLYLNSILPASGENSLNRILLPGALARNPTVDRIPKLKVQTVTMVYGDKDWMNVSGGLEVKRICAEQNSALKSSVVNKAEHAEQVEERSPDINVHLIRNSGHLIMLENWEEFNS